MHQLLLWLDQRGEELQSLALEGAEIRTFRYAPALAQALQNVAERRLAGEPFRLEPPQRGECGIEEFEPLVDAVNRHCRADALEHCGVRAGVSAELGLGSLGVGPIQSKADRTTGLAGELDKLHQPAGAADHDMATGAARAASLGHTDRD